MNATLAGCKDSKDLKKKRRGSYDTAYDKKSNLSVVKWNDNSIVCVTSNFDSVHPLSKTKRLVRIKKNEGKVQEWGDSPDFSHVQVTGKKGNKNPPKAKTQQASDKPPQTNRFKVKTETPPKNEPLYNIGDCTASVPDTERYCQNFDHSGFIPLVRQTYEAMKTIDSRLERAMPFVMFQHHCTVYLTAVILDRDKDQGGRPFGDAERMQSVIVREGEQYLVPEVIQEFVRNLGKCLTLTGEEVYLNTPDISVPRGPGDGYEPGFFGVCDAATHNVYECYVSPAGSKVCFMVTREHPVNLEGLWRLECRLSHGLLRNLTVVHRCLEARLQESAPRGSNLLGILLDSRLQSSVDLAGPGVFQDTSEATSCKQATVV
ncbi:hypothetical protein GE061_016752 [Apolygus lucorum]|uniref:Uncharacterized protein n=1 Tax=Apolygus lucorum TaxID=248454 RepID=A0A8S9XJ62_APOLU|nr:hypothetical protein GE061_016752 [Apolygus lucorum]